MTPDFRRGARAVWLLLSASTLAACAGRAPEPAPRPASTPAANAAPADGQPADAAAAGSGAAGMAGMDHSQHAGHQMASHQMMDMPPITIPEGALITEADVRFMQGMIAHHAQAVYMTRLADGAGASPRVLTLANKIDLSQAGEIRLMQEWLGEYRQVVPDTSSWRGMTMPGMLTAAQLDQLAKARGTEFDRLFLTFMIQHHEGALLMVSELLASPRAAQEVDISVFANDVETTQSAEIGLMHQMLGELPQ